LKERVAFLQNLLFPNRGKRLTVGEYLSWMGGNIYKRFGEYVSELDQIFASVEWDDAGNGVVVAAWGAVQGICNDAIDRASEVFNTNPPVLFTTVHRAAE
jgi:hypothetical protein